MKKVTFRILALGMITGVITLLLMSSTTIAEEETPPPYRGMSNPYPWNDESAQTAGKTIYSQKCSGCHGINGASLSGSDFSTEKYAAELEENPDHYFWVMTEGAPAIGMPGYSASLSDEERWLVLTYTWSLKSAPPLIPEGLPVIENGLLRLQLPDQGTSGTAVSITARLYQNQTEPVPNAPVEFFVQADFFASNLMKIGEVITQANGQAEFSYLPRVPGETTIVARYMNIETSKTIFLASGDEVFYHPEVGIHIPALTDELSIGPPKQLNLGTGGEAPPPILRLPTGHLAWLAPLLLAAMSLWMVYSFVVYQLVRIPQWKEADEIDTRRFPRILFILVTIIGFLLMVMLVLGPESNPHLIQ